MGIYDRDYMRSNLSSAQALSTFSSRVYGWMSVGLALTAFVAYFIYVTEAYISILPFAGLCGLFSLGIALGMSTMMEKLSFSTLLTLFLSYSAAQGVIYGCILPLYASQYGGEIIWTAFASASGLYALAVGYGMFTQADLTNMGRILNLGLVGLLAISLIYFVASFFTYLPMMHLFICYIGLFLFIGLTAYDAQRIREYSEYCESNSSRGYKLSIMLAMSMYMNAILIFWYLLQILSSKKD